MRLIISIILSISACIANLAYANDKNISCFKPIGNIVCCNTDTVVIVKKVLTETQQSDDKEFQYYVSIDSLGYTYEVHITEHQNRVIIRLNSKVSDFSNQNFNNTSSIEKVRLTKKSRTYLSLDQKCNIINRILKRASNDFDFTQTGVIFLDLSSFEEEAILITERYKDLYGLDSNDLSNEKMANLIKESNLFRKLLKLFKTHSIELNEVYVEDIIDISIDKYKRAKHPSELPYILDACVTICTNNGINCE